MPMTLADTLPANVRFTVNCGHPACCKSTKLDAQALIDRLGPGHGSMHWSGSSAARRARPLAAIAGRCYSPSFLTMKASRLRATATGNRRSIEGLRDFSLS